MKFIVLAVIVGLAIFLFVRNANSKQYALENIALGEQFLMSNRLDDGIFETNSGLQYKILHKGDGLIHPTATSKVKVHYHGTLLNETVFDSSVDRNEPISFRLNQVIKGWTEGVQLMVVGDKFKFFIPSHLAYGNSTSGPIQPGSLLVFEVELLAVD